MSEPGPVTPVVLRRMREVITIAIATRSMSVQEAAAEAWGMGRGLQPAPAAGVVGAAVAEPLRDLGCHQAPLAVQDVAATTFSPGGPAEVADSLAYSKRFDGCGKARRTGVEYAAVPAAETLVTRLMASGFVAMPRRPASAHR